jgi:hypothetical protein
MSPQSNRGSSGAELSRAERNIRWIEANLRVPEGAHVGRPMILREWQRDILRKIYDNLVGTRRAIITFGRNCSSRLTSRCAVALHAHQGEPGEDQEEHECRKENVVQPDEPGREADCAEQNHQRRREAANRSDDRTGGTSAKETFVGHTIGSGWT